MDSHSVALRAYMDATKLSTISRRRGGENDIERTQRVDADERCHARVPARTLRGCQQTELGQRLGRTPE